MTIEEVEGWLDQHDVHLERAAIEIERLVREFKDDWSYRYGFATENIGEVRRKSAERIHAKASRKNVSTPAQLLRRCESKDERDRFPVHDLLGIRVLVLSLNGVRAMKEAVEAFQVSDDKYPFGNLKDFDIDDINEKPRADGYRAVHVDSSVTVYVEGEPFEIPFELQIKTLSQEVYGQHTHDESYVPDDFNANPRFELVRGLQRALAGQVNATDLLLEHLEEVALEIRRDIERRPPEDHLTSVAVDDEILRLHGRSVGDEIAGGYAERARRIGIETVGEFAERIDPSGDAAGSFTAGFEDAYGRSPTMEELLDGILAQPQDDNRIDLPQESQAERDILYEYLGSSAPPANELDELDPDAVDGEAQT